MAGLGIVDVLARGLRPPVADASAADASSSSSSASAPPASPPPAPSNAGLVHTLKNMLLKTDYQPHEMRRLLGTPLPQPPPATAAADGSATGSVTFVDALLDLLLADAPDDIAPLMLRNAVLRDAGGARLCAALRTKQRPTVDDRFCLLWQAVRCRAAATAAATGAAADDGDADGGATATSADARWRRELLAAGCGGDFEPGELCAVLVQHWPVLFDTDPACVPTTAATTATGQV